MFTEKGFIDFVYNKASFSKDTLVAVDEVLGYIKQNGYEIAAESCTQRPNIPLKDIKGSCSPQYAGKRWLDVIMEDGYLKEEVEPLFQEMACRVMIEKDDALGKLTLVNINHSYYIKDGHKRITFARYFHEMKKFPASLSEAEVIHYEFTKQKGSHHAQ